jgi:hypothetical protein
MVTIFFSFAFESQRVKHWDLASDYQTQNATHMQEKYEKFRIYRTLQPCRILPEQSSTATNPRASHNHPHNHPRNHPSNNQSNKQIYTAEDPTEEHREEHMLHKII